MTPSTDHRSDLYDAMENEQSALSPTSNPREVAAEKEDPDEQHICNTTHEKQSSDREEGSQAQDEKSNVSWMEDPAKLATQGCLRYIRFERSGELQDIDEGIDCLLLAVSLTADGDPEEPRRLSNLGISYRGRYEYLGDLDDINEAIDCLGRANLLTPDDHPERPARLSNLGLSYQGRFELLDELPDIDKAINCHVQAVSLSPDGHADNPGMLSNLGISYHIRYGRLGNLSDIDEAIKCLVQAISSTPDDHARQTMLVNLSGIYQGRFEHLGELSDIDKAISCSLQAMALASNGRANAPGMHSTLGASFKRRFERLGQLQDINESINHLLQAVSLTPDGHANKPGRLSSLAISYHRRFEHVGDLADISKAIDNFLEAITLTPDGHPEKATWLNNLGNSYERGYDRFGELSDINSAIEHKAQAVSLMPDDHTDKPGMFNNLGNSYLCRFQRLGELSDLSKANNCLLRAVSLVLDDNPKKPLMLNNLGGSYLCRFEHSGELLDVNNAIEYLLQAVSLEPDGHPGKPAALHNLGTSYWGRFKRLGQLPDVDKATECLVRALSLAPDGHPDKPATLSDLGLSYLGRFDSLGELSDINEAIKCLLSAVSLLPNSHPERPRCLGNLGFSHQRRFERLHDSSDINIAVTYFREAAQSTTGPPKFTFPAARQWARLAAKYEITCPQLAYQRAMELLPQLIWLGTTLHRRYELIAEMGNVATEAASYAIGIKAYDCALEWLEQGRSIVWNQILQLRTPFDDILDTNPLLAKQLQEVGCALDNAGSRLYSAPLSADTQLDSDIEAQRHYALVTEWDQLLQQVRSIPSFRDFMSIRKASELKSASKSGPIVVVNLHADRCDALIVQPGIDSIVHVPLKNFSIDKAFGVQKQLMPLIGHRHIKSTQVKPPKPEDEWKPSLKTLWLDVVEPVLSLLGYVHKLPVDQLPHITWCTTGALSFLPLHAAGCYAESHPNACDLVTSSYTPTLGALLTAAPPISGSHYGLLAVGQEDTPGQSRLPCTKAELDAIEDHTKLEEIRFLRLDGNKATINAVLNAMDEYSSVHLACHATQDTNDPAQSAFHLYDGELKLSEVTKRSFKNKGLAFLSACQTATMLPNSTE